jgi:hypothetical protein
MKKDIQIKRGSTMILRFAVLSIGVVVLGLCIGLVFLITDGDKNYRNPIWIGLYVTAVPFYVALYQTLKLLNYIDRNKAFSNLSVKALKNIKYCGLLIAGLFTAGSPYIFYVADRDDSPGLFGVGLVFIGASVSVAVFAAVLERLLQNAIAIKSENDLTV